MSAFGSSSSSSDISGRALNRVKKELEKFNQSKESNEAEGKYILWYHECFAPISSRLIISPHLQYKIFKQVCELRNYLRSNGMCIYGAQKDPFMQGRNTY